MKFTVTVTRVSTYAVEARNYEEAEDIALGALGRKRQEAALVDEDTVRVDVEQDSDVVQVVFTKTGKPYAYAVPEGIDYNVGDLVIVPGTYTGWPQVVEIVATGRGDYHGPLKSVLGKVATPQPKFDWDTVEDDEDEGFGFCPDCGIAFQNKDWKPCGGTIS